jgi:hypothetical protein
MEPLRSGLRPASETLLLRRCVVQLAQKLVGERKRADALEEPPSGPGA